MSAAEKEELAALVVWLHTFPQTKLFCAEKENVKVCNKDILDNPSFESCIFDIAVEVCNVGDGDDSTLAQSGDLWDTVLAMTRKINKRKSLDPPLSDTPHCWEDFRKHAALAYLLDGAVTHKDLDLRRAYIERIMALSGADQRTLMSLIERRKKKPKTPAKKNRSARKKARLSGEPKDSALKESTPLKTTESRSPFSSRDTNFTPDENKKTKSSPLIDDSPQNLTSRRSFEDAFGSTEQYFRAMSPSPKRIPVAPRGLFSPGLGDGAEYEKQLQELKEKNDQLQRDLEKSREKEEDTTKRLEDVESNYRKEMMKIEAASRRREDESKEQYETRLATLRCDFDMLREQYEIAQSAQEELEGVKDEMELMMHTKTMLADTTERLRTYKEKLQQLTDVKDSLQKEEEAHSRSVEECLRLENELKTLQPLKRQLEDYKTRAVDAEVRLAESQDELLKTNQKKLASSDTSHHLEAQIQSQAEEIEELKRRLQHEEKEEASGVGSGMSELNPELKEEVFRLRNENEQLKAFASKREDDAVSKMEQDLEDAGRLTERYKTQFLSTKGQLETTQGDLIESKEREAKLESDLLDTKKLLSETMSEAEGLSRELQQCSEDLEESKLRESKLKEELSFWVEQAKSLQSQTEGLTERLQKCSKDLNESLASEADLKKEVEGWTRKCEDSEAKADDLYEKLRDSSGEVDSLKQQEIELKGDVAEWKQQANTAQQSAESLLAQLQTSRSEVNELLQTEETLKSQILELSEQRKGDSEKIHQLEKHLDNCVEDLDETRKALIESQEKGETLRDELTDMTSRADDSEAVSKQRMELVQSTREKLKTARAENAKTLEERDKLQADVKSISEKHSSLKVHADKVQRELADSRSNLVETQEILKDSQRRASSLEKKLEKLGSECETWRNKAASEESLTERLQEELVQTRDALSKMQSSFKILKDNEIVLKEELDHAEHLIFEMEDSVEEQTAAKENLEKDLEVTQHEKAKIMKELETQKAKLTKRLEEETQQCNKYKQELFSAQETLNETQSSVGASQHREKMLKHEVAKLQDIQADLRKELEAANIKKQEAIEEAAKSLENSCEALNAKAQKEYEELQNNMNQLLEDERRAKRKDDESYKEKLQELREKFESEIAELKAQADKQTKESTDQMHTSIESQKLAYEEKMATMRKEAALEKDKLVLKGKGMLNDTRMKAKEELDEVRAYLTSLQEKLEAETKEKDKIAQQYTEKVTEYKKKLQFTTSRINSLSADGGELEERVTSLEREKLKLLEENDRYRRQLGGRFGSDSKLQNQLEKVQKEFRSAMEEIRELRQKQHSNSDGLARSVLPPIDENGEGADQSYSRDAVNQSTLVQLRTEYEETIEALNDEKRELVMKNSAAITDVQKAEKRAWESEQQNSDLQQRVTSLQLQVERLEHMVSNMREGPEMSPIPKPPASKSSGFESSTEGLRQSKAENGVGSGLRVLGSIGNEEPSDSRNIAKNKDTLMMPDSTETKSFVELHARSPGEEAAPECKQS